MKDMGDLHHFFRVKIAKDSETGDIWMGQDAYTRNVLQNFGMENSKPTNTPVDVSVKLTKATDEDETVYPHLYQSAVGSLLHLSTRTRPDIAYAVSSVVKFRSQPVKQHC